MRRLSQLLSSFAVIGSAALLGAQGSRSCNVDHTLPSPADQAMNRSDYTQAEQMASAVLKERPDDTLAIATLISSRLAQGRLDDALDLARKQLAEHPKEALLEDTLGDVALRRGEPEQALAAFGDALRMDPCLARTHFDISRYLSLSGMAASARKQLEMAHSLAPEDLAIQRAWKAATAVPLTPEQRIAQLREGIEAPGATPEQKAGAAEAIKAIQARERGDCKPVAVVDSTRFEMVPIANGPGRPLYAVGLDVQMNGKRKRLEIDTGASGLLISRGSAISAGLVPEAEIKTGGIGDQGPASAFVTHVDDLRIGNMQFRNCLVRVLEKRSTLDVDGLIGMDVFRNYLITLDTPSRQVRLAPLPKLPDDAASSDDLATAGANTEIAPATIGLRPVLHDRYIAPEMKEWSRIYRIGHQLIIPTRIGNAPSKLFIMDTGASTPIISPQAAREVTHVDANSSSRVRGINGEVKNVSQAEAVTIRFAGVQQLVRGMASVDTSAISHNLGLEIAGFISFPTLSELIITIDYRDDLVNVVYDPKHGYHAR